MMQRGSDPFEFGFICKDINCDEYEGRLAMWICLIIERNGPFGHVEQVQQIRPIRLL